MPTPTDSGCIQPIPRHLEDIRSLAILEERCAKLRAKIAAYAHNEIESIFQSSASLISRDIPEVITSPASDYTCCLSSRNQL